MMQRKLAQHFFTLGGELQMNFAAVFRPALATDKAAGLETVHQLNRAMVLNLETFGDFGDLGTHVERQSLEREKKLMLAGLETRLARRPLAKP